MALTFAAVLMSSVLLVMSASLSKTLRHKPPNECEWLAVTTYGDETIVSQTVSDEQEVALHCQVRTMNSELEKTNFSIIQPQYTVKLKIECNNQLYLLSSLGTGTFQTLIDLKELTIDSCKLNTLARESFRGLRQLRNLTVVTHNNDWTSVNMEVQSDAFLEELNMLERLDLSYNNMAKLPEAVFCSLQNLVYLNLTRNRLRHLELFHFGSSGQQKCGATLQVLDLSHNNFDSVNSQVFSHLSNLQELYLQGNVLSVIGDHGFDGMSALSVLNVASNRLVNLAPELFADTRELREMYLQNNTINVLAPGLFNELSRLLVLDLSENQLTEEWVNAATFTGLVRLVLLSLSNNNITKLDATIFRDLFRLRSLRLDNNGVQHLPENVFSTLIDMRTLVLSSNKLTRIDQFTFDGLPSLNQLSLDNNQIQYIDPEALRNSTDLEYLHLNGNKLYDIPAVLNNVPNLKTLDLGYNQITDIFNTSFPAMSQLIGLKLLKNQISNVSKGVFDRLPELHLINLANNKIQKIEPGTFDNNTRLVAVRVDGNYLRDVGGLFSKLSNLVWLNISENFLEWFDYALIPTGLQWLDIHGNQITELGNHYELETQLTGFDASNNKLTEVTGSSIPDKVQNLYLSNNQISKIQSYAFFKKPNLTQVDLTGNRLRTLNPQSLRISTVPGGRPMPQFLVGNNPFVCDCSMQWLQAYSVEPDRNKPKLVDLETATCEVIYNRGESRVLLKEASEEQFLCQYDMECAKRSTCDCCDFDACDCKMICPTNCTCFHSVSSTSNVVDCSGAGYVNRVPDKIPMNTTVLYLDGNTVRTLSTHAFLGRKILKVLYLNSSNVERVQNRTFLGLKELEVLHLDDNRVSTLHGDEFYGLDKLKELYLNHNRITYVNGTTFRFLQQLTVLRLDHNRIVQFPVWRLSPTLTQLTVAENHWSCACDFVQQMKEFLQYAADAVTDADQVRCLDHSGGFNIFSDNGTAVCGTTATPPQPDKPFNGSSNMIEGALNSGGNLTTPIKTVVQRPDILDYVPILIVSFSAVFFIVVTAMVVYVFRHEMKVWCHSRFGVRIFCKSTEFEMDERDKLFDAFVSYSSKDEAFVVEELAPILENGDPSYKLCLHYREFPAGGYISDTIVQAVESSKRTIMVLSENFIKSEWCRFEFKSAHHQVLRDKRKRLIVILLGEVPNKDLDPDIRLYLKTNSYLQWGDKHFWEKLKFALPDVPNNQRPKAINHKHHHHHHHHHNRGVHNNYSRPLAIHI
ncbi:toll-like receptor Tollo [Sipha flava]|uniref:Toll-like receptor Tollo n=1 Tax=Sipha flava TaxID=143950 RepID=A0A8B8GAM7_9HEMI|nr:toll-like receptor Tollo [Sipha flava]